MAEHAHERVGTSEHVRVGDDERRSAAELLTEAAGAGLLGLDEVDERLAAAYRAQTSGELARLRADLPPAWLARRERERAARAAQQVERSTFRAHLLSYLGGMGVMVAIWLVVGVTAGAWYPWPIWPALGWGIGVWSHGRAAAGRAGHGGGCGARMHPPQGAAAR